MTILARMLVVLVAFTVAAFTAFTALAMLSAIMLDSVVQEGPPEHVYPGFVVDFFSVLILIGPGIVITSAIAVLAVVIGEVTRIRSWIYYVLAAGAAFSATPVLAAGPAGRLVPNPDLLTACASAGFVGGFVYWLIAGRHA